MTGTKLKTKAEPSPENRRLGSTVNLLGQVSQMQVMAVCIGNL
jgi:hypothetical protein